MSDKTRISNFSFFTNAAVDKKDFLLTTANEDGMVRSTGFSVEIFLRNLAYLKKISTEKERSDISSECRGGMRSSEYNPAKHLSQSDTITKNDKPGADK